jgi:hypothetical protein
MTGESMTTTTLLPRFPMATPLSTPDVWYPPAPTKASRLPALRSRGSSRGVIVGSDNQARVYESFLEARAMLVLMSRKDVAQIVEQQRVTFRDDRGVLRWHVFDFLVTKTNGERIAVAVKPAEVAEKRGLALTLKDIAGRITRSFADRVVLMTERSMDRATEFNAALFHSALHYPTGELDTAVDRIVSGLTAPATIHEIAKATGFSGRAFWSVVRLIDLGVLTLVRHAKITHRTLVRLVTGAEGSSQAAGDST